MRRLFRQFSFPGGIPSHVAPETPGSIHEGGELGYALVARLRRGLRQPRPARRAASSATARRRPGPLAASWHSNKFLDPRARRRGAADPAPERLQDRQPDGARAHPARTSSRALLRGLRLRAALRRRATTRRDGAPALRGGARRRRSTRSRAIQRARPADGATERPRWPMIVLRTPKGWTGPEEVDGLPVEGTWRAHQVPLAGLADEPGAPARCSRSGCASYRPEELFDEDGAPGAELRRAGAARARAGWARTRTPTAACCCATSSCPTSATTPSTSREPADDARARRRASSAGSCATSCAANAASNFRLFGPGRDRVEPARAPCSR